MRMQIALCCQSNWCTTVGGWLLWQCNGKWDNSRKHGKCWWKIQCSWCFVKRENAENRKTSVDAMYCLENGGREALNDSTKRFAPHKLYSCRTHRNHNGVALASSTEPPFAFTIRSNQYLWVRRCVSIHLRGIHFCVVANVKCTLVRHSFADTHAAIWNRAKPICLQPTRKEENRSAFEMPAGQNGPR